MKDTSRYVFMVFVIVLLFIIVLLPSSIAPNIVGSNYKNVTVMTKLNISNSRPEILSMIVYDATNSSLFNITVNAGAFKTISCNASVRDWNGFSDITNVNATLYHITNNSIGPDNNNTHYTNTSCNLNASTGTYTGWYVCNFDVIYYANNGTWNCNVTLKDTKNSTGSLYNSTFLYGVYALNITDGIDYGSLLTGDFSNNLTANITNFGNMGINVSVEGYAFTRGDGLAMNCSTNGNITVGNEKFSTSQVDYASKIALTSSPALIPGLTISKQINDTVVVNTTYWQLYVDSTNVPAGICTGFIIFSAEAP